MEIQTVFPHHTASWQILRPNAGNVHVENLGSALELTYNYYGSEDDETNWYHVGNQEKDRFGHVAFNTQECYSKINAMRVLSRDWPCLRYDPDGYWVEIVRGVKTPIQLPKIFQLCRSMVLLMVQSWSSHGPVMVQSWSAHSPPIFWASGWTMSGPERN